MAVFRTRIVSLTALILGIVLLGLPTIAKANVFNLTNRGGIPLPVLQEMSRLEDEKGRFITWSLEDKAMSETLNLDEGLALTIEDDPIHTLPTENDIPEAEALRIAKETILARYVVQADVLDTYPVYTAFIERPEAGKTYWAFDFHPESIGQNGRYHVEISSADGSEVNATWDFYDFWSSAATLAKQGKLDALNEHIHDEAFKTLSLAEKATYSKLLREAGYTPFEKGYFHITPGEDALPQADAISIATDTIKTTYGFTDNVLQSTVETYTSFMETPGGEHLWIIEFAPMPYRERYGLYRVEISAASGEMQSITWSLEDAYDPETAADDLHGDVLGAKQLDTLLTLTEEQQQLQAEREAALGIPFDAWSLEDKAALSAVWVEKGHPKEDMVLHVLPGEDDIQPDDALAFARNVLTEKFSISEETLDRFTVYTSFLQMPYGLESIWDLSFVPSQYEDIDLGEYRVSFTSPSGVIEYCTHYVEVGYLAPLPPEDPSAVG